MSRDTRELCPELRHVTRSTMKPQLTPLSIGGGLRSTATHGPIRAIGVQSACWRAHARGAIVPLSASAC